MNIFCLCLHVLGLEGGSPGFNAGRGLKPLAQLTGHGIPVGSPGFNAGRGLKLDWIYAGQRGISGIARL